MSVRVLPAALLCCMGWSALACDNPSLVQIPATEDVAGREADVQQDVAEYVAAMQVYTDCIKAELAAAGGETAPDLQRAMLVRRNNLAVAEVEAVLKWLTAATGIEATIDDEIDAEDDEDSRGRRRERG